MCGGGGGGSLIGVLLVRVGPIQEKCYLEGVWKELKGLVVALQLRRFLLINNSYVDTCSNV